MTQVTDKKQERKIVPVRFASFLGKTVGELRTRRRKWRSMALEMLYLLTRNFY